MNSHSKPAFGSVDHYIGVRVQLRSGSLWLSPIPISSHRGGRASST